MKTFTLHELHPAAWAAIADEGGVAVGNAAFVDLGDDVLVFDTTVSIAAGRELRAAAERHGMIANVVYSHWHGDHVFGANAMSGASYVIATEGTKQLLETRGVERIAQLKADPPTEGPFAELNDDLQRLQVIYPDETFTDARAFEGMHRSAHAITHGGGHTLSDAFLWLPEERILFAGDLVVAGTHPWVGDGDLDAWPGILERMAQLRPQLIVPGHGPVSDEGAIDFMLGYLDVLQRAEPDAPIPPEYASLEFPGVWSRNLDALAARHTA